MTKQKKKHFQFSLLEGKARTKKLKAGASGDDVRSLQSFLSQSGYLGSGRMPGTMCDCTCKALRYFQKCYGLDDSGEADRETLELIQRPRCGNPDVVPGTNASAPAPFVLRGCQYDETDLTYAFLNSTPDLTVDRQREIIREAFGVWAEVTPLRFTEVDPGDNPTFPISFERGNHGDGAPFDDGGTIEGNTLAHAFFPGACGGINAGSLHFDEFESWVDGATAGGIRLLNVSIHEIGHLLGLSHSNNQDAIMFAFYDDDVDSLRQDDINGIQALYGARPAGSPLPIRGQLNATGDQNIHRVCLGPGTVTVALNGPPGADFDLYLRSGLQPTRSQFDARGFSPGPDETLTLRLSGGELFILVDSFRGSGSYEVEITAAP